MFNVNSYKEKYGYENQIKHQGGRASQQPQPDGDSWSESQNERQGGGRDNESAAVATQSDNSSWSEGQDERQSWRRSVCLEQTLITSRNSKAERPSTAFSL